jgi:transcriptional regulator with XRE-family HTH domain
MSPTEGSHVPKKLSTILQRLRKAKVISQRTQAAKIGVKGVYIAQLETGARKNPPLDVLKRIARALGVPVTELME